MITSMMTTQITIKRQSTEPIKLKDASASLTISNSPMLPAVVQIAIIPFYSGTVEVVGTAKNDSAQTETLTFTAGYGTGTQKGFLLTTKQFKTVTSLTCTGDLLTNTVDVTASYRSPDGSAVQYRTILESCYPASFSRGRASWKNSGNSGTTQEEKITITMPYTCTLDLRAGDIVINNDTSEQFMVTGDRFIDGVGFNRCYQVFCERRENY